MPLHFLDTSALAKRYLPERGSEWLKLLIASDAIAVSDLAIVELASTVARRTREGNIDFVTAQDSYEVFLSHLLDYAVLPVDRPVLVEAAALLRRSDRAGRLRSLDAIQLATAQTVFRRAERGGQEIGSFVSADRALNDAARGPVCAQRTRRTTPEQTMTRGDEG